MIDIIGKVIILGFGFMYATALLCVVFDIIDEIISTYLNSKKRNRVHFYVARNMDGILYLYLGKPIRGITEFHGVADKNIFVLTNNLKSFGLNQDDFKYLKWKNAPVEVFVNMKD